MLATGITGQSSSEGRWLWPITYQTTTSVSVDVAVGLGPGGESLTTDVLVGVVAGGVALVGVVGGDPQVVPHVACPLRIDDSSVANGRMFSPAISLYPVGVPILLVRSFGGDHLPVPADDRVDGALGLQLGLQDRRLP
jgi:hypothetical protein